jgi:hypothetical protein
MNMKTLTDESVECPDRWCSRADAIAVTMAISLSESWPRRFFVASLARMGPYPGR